MKTHLLILPLVALLASCVSRPVTRIVHTDGTVETVYLGGHVAAEADNVIASVKTARGTEVKYAAKREDGTSVPNNLIGYKLAKALAGFTAHSTDLKTETDGAVALKGTKDPNFIPDDPEHLPEIPLDPNQP